MAATFRDYGPTIDEESQSLYGQDVLAWYGSRFQDSSALTFKDLYLYGGFFECLAELGTRVLPFARYDARHLVNALFGVLGIVAAWGLGRELGGAGGGFWAAVFLTATPTYYGHMFNNPKDIPFAALYAASLWLLARAYRGLPEAAWSSGLASGISMGLTLGVRVGGVLLWGYTAALWAAFQVVERLRRGVWGGRLWRSLFGFVGVPLAVSWGVMLLFWPWAQVSPVLHPLEAMRAVSHFKADWEVLFDGRHVPAEAVPWTYLPVWFWNSLPEFHYAALGAGCVLALRGVRRGGTKVLPLGMVVVAVVLPVAAAMALHATIYDGTRHFLFILPPLAVLSGVSLSEVLGSGWGRAWRWSVAGLVALGLGSVARDMVSLHPYQSVYFNRLVCGGLRGAAGRFETDYWGSTYKEGIEWVLRYYRPPAHEKIRVANCSSRFLTGDALESTPEGRARFESSRRRADPHVFLATTKRDCHTMVHNATLLHVVERQGVPLLYVFEMRRPE